MAGDWQVVPREELAAAIAALFELVPPLDLDMEIDPYHAVATARRGDVDRVSAAEVLLAGLIRVDAVGELSLTGEGTDPAGTPKHPVPAALLSTLRRPGPPTALYPLYWDTDHRNLQDAFLGAEDAKVPRWSARTKDALAPLAVLTAALLALWCAVQIVVLRPEGTPPGAGLFALTLFLCFVLWVMLAVPMVWAALMWWPRHRDPFGEYCRRLLALPAEQGLHPEQRERLERSTRDPVQKAKDREVWIDGGGGC